tara:strand:+ start:4228 stop:6282 length:2055 start_codon:yes stop_codon:yes gene_type:complete
MNKNNAGFLAFVAVAVAAAIGAFFVSPKLFKAEVETATQSAPASNLAGDGAGDAATAPQEDTGTEVASAEPTEPSGADAWTVPSFDVLRVEPDGSTVIAGKAEPGTTLNIMNGDTVIASTQVGPSGDFAAVLDTPLEPGDYQLTLEIVGKDGATRRSEEVATVSIPKDAGGELLAMVSKPGKASRIIAQPAAPADGQPAAEQAATEPEADAPVEVASSEPAETTNDAAATVAEPEAEAAQADPAPAAEPADAATEMAAADAAAVSGAQAPAPGTIETPALPEASSLLTTTAPEVASGSDAAPDAAPADAPQPEATAEAEPEAEVALAAPEPAADPAAPALPAGANVRVDAVEIEGDRIFVAGSAPPGYTVRVSADGVVIGTEKADETGRFIIEATSELAVGDHIISADLLDSAGQEVVLRATVPFNRPEGEALAAVAPSEPAPAVTEGQAAPERLILPDIASLSKMREDSFQALSTLERLVSASESPDAGAVSSAYDDAVAKLKAAAAADLPEGSGDEAMAMAQSMRAQAEAALAAIQPSGSDAGAEPAASGDADPATDTAGIRDRVRQAETALSEPADIAVAAANAPDPASNEGGQGEPRTIVQAPLASSPGAVIIRRGDTLWQISRRTYGQGVRYTTIYVANRSQIQNPNRIKPGQVFSVPESPLDNAEQLHKELLGGPKQP